MNPVSILHGINNRQHHPRDEKRPATRVEAAGDQELETETKVAAVAVEPAAEVLQAGSAITSVLAITTIQVKP